MCCDHRRGVRQESRLVGADVNAAAIDIGTNSMRLLVVDPDGRTVARDSEVTGLGTGVDATGAFDDERVRQTLEVMRRFRVTMDANDAGVRLAVATSATRDASNGAWFAAEVGRHLGVVPEVISGAREAALAFAGATRGRGDRRCVVVDIGGGSTEFIEGSTVPSALNSVDIGSVRLTDRMLPDRPASTAQLSAATEHVAGLFSEVDVDRGLPLIGVAGTFTSLAAIARGLDHYDRSRVDGAVVQLDEIREIVDRLARLSIEETAAIPALQPKRAPVILAGALIALSVLTHLSAASVTVSESDLLDALAAEALQGG